jgi:hypothetical protein
MSTENPAPHDAEPPVARRRDRTIGLLIVAVAFAGALCISWWAKVQSRPETSDPPGPPTTEGIVGFPERVDAVKTLPAARKLTKRDLLRGFVLEGVKSDGSVDLSEGPGRVRYSFQSSPGKGPQPAREPGTLPRKHYCGKQNVNLRREGMVADPDVAEYPCSPVHTEHLQDPRCGAREVWQKAIEKGAPRDRMARIEYYRARGGPAWRFELPGTEHRFSLYGDCSQELDPNDAFGSVP